MLDNFYDEKNLFCDDGKFPPKKPSLTLPEELESTRKNMSETIQRLLRFEERLNDEFNRHTQNITSDNVIFKQTLRETWVTFIDKVRNEINEFESNVDNTVALFQKDIENNYSNLSEEVKTEIETGIKEFDEKLKAFETQITDQYNSLQNFHNESIELSNSEMQRTFSAYTVEMNTLFNTFKATVNGSLNDIANSYTQYQNTINQDLSNKLAEIDSKVISAENYMRTNLVASITNKLNELVNSGEITNVLDNSVETSVLNYTSSGENTDMTKVSQALSETVSKLVFPKANYYFNKTFVINKSRIEIDFNKSVINCSVDDIPVIEISKGVTDVVLKNLKIDGKSKANVGIRLMGNNKNITIDNAEIMYIKGSNTYTYGVAIPCFGCENITVKNSRFYSFNGVDDGNIGDFRGWNKGVIVGYNGWLNSDIPDSVTDTTYSKDIKIINNTFDRIRTAEDGDAIYVEGLSVTGAMLYDLPVRIEGNYFKNIGKRFIKVVPAGGTIIRNNYGEITSDTWQTERMHSFISVYAPNSIIENNEFYCRSKHVLYCIDVGIQAEYGEYKNAHMIIKNNKIYNSSDREGDNVACVYYAPYTGSFDTLTIEGNIFYTSYNGIYFDNENSINSEVKIKGNTFTGSETAFRPIEIQESVKVLTIEDNLITEGFSNSPINIEKCENVNILNNTINAKLYSVIKCACAMIKNNFIINIANTHRFNVTASKWNCSVNNNDTAGGSVTW